MKTLFIASCLAASFVAGSASADDFSSEISVTAATSGLSVGAAQNMEYCLSANPNVASSKAIRACTKAYKASKPIYELWSEILVRRGSLLLSSGKYEKAARDFTTASKLSSDINLAYIGQGFSALAEKNTSIAKARFKDCDKTGKFAPLVAYGLGLAHEQAGDQVVSTQAYEASFSP